MSITIEQVGASLLAVFAFIPVMVCPGYVAGWLSNLYGFRTRSVVERLFWSVPLSFGLAPIGLELSGRFFGLNAAVLLVAACGLSCGALLFREFFAAHREGRLRHFSLGPYGASVLVIAGLWAIGATAWLADIQVGDRLYPSLLIFDHSMRTNWTESVLRTGIPPANPLYMYRQAAPMRNYYFWYILCAVTARVSRLPVQAVLSASCVWSGFALAALIGLYLKYFLSVGERLRMQYLRCVGLLAVSGLGIWINVWRLLHGRLPYIEVWPNGQIGSWTGGLLYAPHHAAGLICCMFALLLVWMSRADRQRHPLQEAILIACCLASAFGLTIYVAFAFFVLSVFWGAWLALFEKDLRSPFVLAAGGLGAALLLVPYMLDLMRGPSGKAGSALFSIAVREMIPPESLLASAWMRPLAAAHPWAAFNLAKLLLLIPGYAVELGFALLVCLTYAVPAWRGMAKLDVPRRWLLAVAFAALPAMSLLRSGVLITNDFGWKSALFFEFPMLLLGSEIVMAWRFAQRSPPDHAWTRALPVGMPAWLRAASAFALLFGLLTVVFQALLFRGNIPLVEANLRASNDPKYADYSHGGYVLRAGFLRLKERIPEQAVVQFNPGQRDGYWTAQYALNIGRQVAITGDQPWCGAELGGDPSGCAPMAAAFDGVFEGSDAAQARAACREYGVQYLVATAYDPAWKRGDGWVWTLPAVVADPEFRALDCR